MNDNLTEIGVVIDESGSMSGMRTDVIGGFNEFLKEQLEVDGKANLTLTKFNTEFDNLYNGADLKKVKPLTEKTYCPGGMTALYDAVGTTIDSIGKRLAVMKEKDRPSKVIIVIITDGEENSSHEYNYDRIKGMITEQTDKYKWQFVFLGVGIDAMAAGTSIGINARFCSSAVGASETYTTATDAIRSYRSSGKVNL